MRSINIQIGITSFMFRYRAAEGASAQELLELAAKLGAEVFQLCENTGILEKSREELGHLRRHAAELGIRLEVGTSGLSEGSLEKALRVTEELDARILRAVIDGGKITPQEAIPHMEKVLPFLEKLGVYLCIENHFRFTPAEIVNLIQKLNHEQVKACLDPLNSIARLVGPEESIRLLSPYARTAHLKDAHIQREGTGWRIKGTLLGKGQVDLEGYLRALPADLTSLLLEGWMDPDPGARPEDIYRKEWEWAEAGMEWMREHHHLIGNSQINYDTQRGAKIE